MSKQTISCDFDGVIHGYIQPWTRADVIKDPPVDGAIEWLNALADDDHYEVIIVSTRAESSTGQAAIRNFLLNHDYKRAMDVRIVSHKPPALMYIDDRAWLFTGDNFPTLLDIANFRPWNHEQREAAKAQQT